jgi:hypothetical protein
MEGVVFSLGDRGTWRRTGECCRCGECCKGGDPSPGDARFTEEELAGRQFDGECPLLRLADGRHGCAGHGEHPFYLAGCIDHPRCPDEMALTPSCSYVFERLA